MNTIVQEKLVELQELCERHKVRRLELFGSAASGQFDPEKSDLDILVEFQPLCLGEYADMYFGLLEGLQSLFGRPVDLVMATAVENRYFLEAIQRKHAIVYAA